MNAESPDSLRVANEWVRLRGIPASHVLYLTGVPAKPQIDAETFRTAIWKPIRDRLAAVPWGEEIDLIAYSAGFPYLVDFAQDLKDAGKTAKQGVLPGAALTAMTYLARRVEKKDVEYLDLWGNKYFRGYRKKGDRLDWEDSRGFHSRYEWRDREQPRKDGNPDSLDRYWLSVMLAYTGQRGTTADEAVTYLTRAAACDGTKPEGTVYLMENENVRATTRMPLFASTVESLQAIGRKATILAAGKDGQSGVLPQGCDDVVGLLAGTAGFQWGPCKSRLLPGSIAEHLTSYGAAFEIADQTKCTEFLKEGAAGTCGAVAEPYALQMKFPVPHLHVHYARGCSLAEAFYQSLEGPYQLLILGDPLARPFATFATVKLASPDAKAPWKGSVEVSANVTAAPDHPIETVELWVDGARVGEAKPGSPIPWDTTKSEDGAHDLRLVAVEDGLIETRSSFRALVHVANGANPVKVKAPASVDLGEAVKLTGSAKGAKTLEILLGGTVLASVPVRLNSWKADVPSERLGAGPVTLTARAILPDGTAVLSDPISIEIEAPAPPEPSKPNKKGH